MPTAVMIESSENTRSMTMIWPMMAPKVARTAAAAPGALCSAWSSYISWISPVAFQIRNSPPASRIRSRPEISLPSTVKIGAVRPMIQASVSSSAMRMNIARNRPMRRATSRCAGGSRSTRIEMKTMLSMPSTSSSAVSVANAIQACGSVRSST